MNVSSPSSSIESGENTKIKPRRSEKTSSEKSLGVNMAYSSIFPLFGIAITLLVMTAFQLVQLSMERSNIVAVKNNQNAAVIESEKVRAQFDSLVKGTVKLAANGNLNAAQIVRQLEEQGVTISRNVNSAQ